MAGAELVARAAEELYGADLAEFTRRRKELAARARQAGQADAAKEIEGLRKPTRAAWVVNQVVRTDPSVPSRLVALGDQLRAAEAALDGAKLRELSRARRELIDAVGGQASALPGRPQPSASVQEEVTATFEAALADPEVARQLAEAALVRAVRRAGFGSAERPALSLVTLPQERNAPSRTGPADRTAASGRHTPARARTGPAAGTAAPAQSPAPARARSRPAKEKPERERLRAVADAERALREADRAADAAGRAERAEQNAVRKLERELAGARERLAEAELRASRAERARDAARQARDRLTGGG